jgi:phosphate transport system substrate-binding protein
MLRFLWMPLVIVVIAWMAFGCGGGFNPEAASYGIDLSRVDERCAGAIRIDGSSTVYKISQAAAEEFCLAAKSVVISVAYKGTGGGFKSFVRGELDICDASRPIQESEVAKCKEHGVEFIELPIAFDALTIAVNRKADWVDSMTVDELKKLWEPAATNKVMKWNDIRPNWPDKEIKLFGAGTDSGTFEYFTEAVVGQKNNSRSDYTAAENDNVIIKGIEGDRYALGYVPYAYYAPRSQSLKALSIDWEKNDLGAIAPSPQTVEEGTYAPLSRPLFLYVNKQSAERPEVAAFIEFYLRNGSAIAKIAKYIPLPESAYQQVIERFDERRAGTAFGGHSRFGMHIDDVLQLELK